MAERVRCRSSDMEAGTGSNPLTYSKMWTKYGWFHRHNHIIICYVAKMIILIRPHDLPSEMITQVRRPWKLPCMAVGEDMVQVRTLNS